MAERGIPREERDLVTDLTVERGEERRVGFKRKALSGFTFRVLRYSTFSRNTRPRSEVVGGFGWWREQ